jgi:membrane dipeptidase
LTDAGKRLVRRCAELGIAIDVSHLNTAGFWDVAREYDGPLIASHSGVHALCPSTRNLTDDQLDAVDLVGINFDTGSLRADGGDDADTPVERIAEHARYVADRVGVDHVALGSDFDGATMPAEVADASGLPRVLEALGGAGFGAPEVDQIASGNWRRVLAAAWG